MIVAERASAFASPFGAPEGSSGDDRIAPSGEGFSVGSTVGTRFRARYTCAVDTGPYPSQPSKLASALEVPASEAQRLLQPTGDDCG